MTFPADLLQRSLHRLKHRGPRFLLRLGKRLPVHLTELESVREHLGYLQKRETLMQYPTFRQNGWPIGSGMVESANKLVVEARLCRGWHALGTNQRLSHTRFTQWNLQ